MTMQFDGNGLRRLREQRGWSQQQLAEVAGVSVRTVQRLETGGSATGETRMAVAAALDVAPADLALATADRARDSRDGQGDERLRPGRPEWMFRVAWMVLLVLGFLLVAGYQVGKDLAFSEARCDDATGCARP